MRKNQRALFVVISLATDRDQKMNKAVKKSSKKGGNWDWLYNFLEKKSARIVRNRLKDHYGTISVLDGAAATKSSFLKRLGSLANRSTLKAVDLIVCLHGASGTVYFEGVPVKTSVLKNDIRDLKLPNRLRLVYNTSCYGKSHNQDFLGAGFKTSVGSRQVNANAAIEFPAFCRIWPTKVIKRVGLKFKQEPITISGVFERADRPVPRKVQDGLARTIGGFSRVNSEKVIAGNRRLTINTVP